MIEDLPADLVVLSVAEALRKFETRPRWLAPAEEAERRELRVPKRHDEWLAGRVAAKRAVQRTTGLPFARIVIRRSPRTENRGQPEVFVDGGTRLPGHLSISHAAGYALATHGPNPVGVDLEALFVPEPSFLETAFSPAECRRLLAFPQPERAHAATRAWCEKEAYAKWLGQGFALPLIGLDPSKDDRVAFEGGRLSLDSNIFWARAQNRV